MQTGRGPVASFGTGDAILGSNQAGMRAHNERLVLTLIRRHGPTAKADIARATGLSAQTVSVIMRALEAEGLLVRGDPVRGRVGQPSVPMALAPGGAYFLGLMVGRRASEMVLTDFLGKPLHRLRRRHSHPLPLETLQFARSGVEELAETLPPEQRRRIAGLGIAMPYQMWDWADQQPAHRVEMEAWQSFDLRTEIEPKVPYPVYVQNDASAACAAELVFGTADPPPDFLHFYIAYFIGGGIVLNGGLFTGPTGNAGALGSLPVPGPDGRSRQLIDVASLSGLAHRIADAGAPERALWDTPEDIPLNADWLDPWVEEAAAGIAHAIVAAVSVIDVQTVLLDGSIPSALRATLVRAVVSKLDGVNTSGLTLPDVREGTIGPDARSLGAASLALSERFLVESA